MLIFKCMKNRQDRYKKRTDIGSVKRIKERDKIQSIEDREKYAERWTNSERLRETDRRGHQKNSPTNIKTNR